MANSRLFHTTLNIFCHMLWIPFVYSHGLPGDKCVTSIQGATLQKHSYKSVPVQDMFVCYYKCKYDKLCQSLNFYRDRNVCELNNRTHSASLPLNFVPDPNAFYLENPYRAFLGSSSLLPASSCREIKEASKGLAPSDRYWLNSGGAGNQPVCAYCDMDKVVIVECTVNPCQNGGSCDYQGEGQYSCGCFPGYSGDHCETEVPDCNKTKDDISSCVKENRLNPRPTVQHPNASCEDVAGPECNSYTLDKAADRSITHATVGASLKCDSALVAGWYRFNSTAGSKMPTSCVASNMCNTHATGWLNGAHPTPQEGVVNRNACFNWSGNCCNWQLAINVRNCGLFYVYKLVKPPSCHLRYCVTK